VRFPVCCYRGSECQSVSHPASGCLRAKDQTQEGRDPQGTDPHRGRPHRGRPTIRGSDPHKGRDPHRRHTDTVPPLAIVVFPSAVFGGALPPPLRSSECAFSWIMRPPVRPSSGVSTPDSGWQRTAGRPGTLAFTRYSFTLKLYCGSQSSFYCPPPTCKDYPIAILLHDHCAIDDFSLIPL